MQIKTFSGRTSKEVLSQIKDALGPDAVILDTQEKNGQITMTAALERNPGQASPEPASQAGRATALSGFDPVGGQPTRFYIPSPALPLFPPPAEEEDNGASLVPTYSPRGRIRNTQDDTDAAASLRSAHEAPQTPGDDAPGPARPVQPAHAYEQAHEQIRPGTRAAPSSPPPPGWQLWHEEWNSIKSHLLALMKPAMRLDLLPPRQRLAIEFLQREGVEDNAVLSLFQCLQADPSASILSPLAAMVPVRPWGLGEWPQRLQMVAGPFGAGKTSVAIRMALTLRRETPACRICMVNADATRGNGRLLLKHYCELSELAYKEAASTIELVAVLNQATKENYDRIIVDLPGLSRGRHLATLIQDAGLAEHCGETTDDLAVHLTLPPLYDSQQLQGVLTRYRVPHATGIVWTKLDELERYGQIVNVALATNLPVSALSFGPGLGNSLAQAKEDMLWRLLFKRELPVGN